MSTTGGWTRGTALWLAVGLAGVAWAATVLWAGAPGGFFGGDLTAYVNAARRLAESATPYHPVLYGPPLANIRSNIPVGYIYPPPLAQAFSLLPAIDPTTLASIWILVQAALLALVLPRVARQYAPAVSPLRRLAVVLAFAATSFPLSFALYGGNVSAWVAIGVGLLLIGGAKTRGAVAAGLTLLKAVPFPFLLIAIVNRPSRLPALLTLGVGVAVSFVVAPEAWLDWMQAWPHIAAMTPGPAPSNLSPAVVAVQLGLEGLGRAIGMILAVCFGAAAVVLSLRGRWPAAVAAATISSLLVSPTLWDHYIAAVVPIVIAAWWIATPSERLVIAASWVAMLPMWLGLGNAGASLLWLAALLAVSIAAIRALGRVAPEPTQGNLPSVGLHWGRKDLAGDEI